MSEDQFTKLFNYMRERFDDVDVKFDGVYKRLDEINNQLDALAVKADIDDTERLVMARQLDRHLDWIEKAGKKIGLQYKHAG